MNKAKIVAVGNQKGGCGKTTLSANLSRCLYEKGYKVLAVDLDSSRNLSISTPGYDKDSCTIFDLLRGTPLVENGKKRKMVAEDVININEDTYDLIASEPDLKRIDLLLAQEKDRDKKYFALRDALSTVADKYDFIILDCPPSLCERYDNAYAAANYIIIPAQLDLYCAQALSDALKTVIDIRNICNPTLQIAGILRTMANMRILESRAWSEQLSKIAEAFNTKLFDTTIRIGQKPCARALDNHTCLVHDDPNSKPAEDYKAFAEEFLAIVESEKE